jgi:hypothetical protein
MRTGPSDRQVRSQASAQVRGTAVFIACVSALDFSAVPFGEDTA